MKSAWLAVAMMWMAHAAFAQDADLTIFVGGALLDHGGMVEVRALAVPDLEAVPQTITVTDRFARVTLRYNPAASYNFRFRPAPDTGAREGLERFSTQGLSVGSLVELVDGIEQEYDTQDIRVLPFAEYGAADPVERVIAEWGETQAFADPPPANIWGARALPQVFDTTGDRRIVRLICADQDDTTVCTPDPADDLLMEALWWREIAEARLERLRDRALAACYDSGGLFSRPESCEPFADDGYPAYRPVE
jgi:hypothetical protein